MPEPQAPAPGFRAGLILSIPLVLGYFPIAFSFGVAATRAGLSGLEAVMFSVVIFAGAAQFLALVLVASGAPLVVTALTLILMNLRHVMYGPVLMEKAGRHADTRHAWAWAWLLTDEVFATILAAMARGTRFSEKLISGTGIAVYLAWISGTVLGVVTGSGALDAYPPVDAALGFMLPALFLALLLSIFDQRQIVTVATATLATVLGTYLVSASVGILAGMVFGALAGTLTRTQA